MRRLRGNYGDSSLLFAGKKTENKNSHYQFYILVELLKHTGIRISEALRLRHSDLHYDFQLYIRASKGSQSRLIHIPEFLYLCLAEQPDYDGLIFHLTYQFVYRTLKREHLFLKVSDQNQKDSITHSFRKNLIRKFFYEWKNPISFIIDFFGWKEKKSLLYYL